MTKNKNVIKKKNSKVVKRNLDNKNGEQKTKKKACEKNDLQVSMDMSSMLGQFLSEDVPDDGINSNITTISDVTDTVSLDNAESTKTNNSVMSQSPTDTPFSHTWDLCTTDLERKDSRTDSTVTKIPGKIVLTE